PRAEELRHLRLLFETARALLLGQVEDRGLLLEDPLAVAQDEALRRHRLLVREPRIAALHLADRLVRRLVRRVGGERGLELGARVLLEAVLAGPHAEQVVLAREVGLGGGGLRELRALGGELLRR